MYGTGRTNQFAYLIATLAVVVSSGGCQTTGGQTSFANPFMAPDRVPPPTTRALAPGSAAPYYPGDPVSMMQGALPVSQPLLAAPAPIPVSPITPINSAPPAGFMSSAAPWNTVAPPIVPSMPQPSQNFVQPASFNAAPTPNNFAPQTSFGSQPSMMPSPMTQSPMMQPPMTQSPMMPSPMTQPLTQDVADTGFSQPGLPASANPNTVLQSQLPPEQQAVAAVDEPNPWRSPGTSNQPNFAYQQDTPLGPQPDVQSVTLQPVAAPVAADSAPRVRIPGYPAPIVDPAVQQANFVVPVQQTMQPCVPQTVAITEFSSHPPAPTPMQQSIQPSIAANNSPWQDAPSSSTTPATAGADGFRPRTSLR
jgi:hypothetical protein